MRKTQQTQGHSCICKLLCVDLFAILISPFICEVFIRCRKIGADRISVPIIILFYKSLVNRFFATFVAIYRFCRYPRPHREYFSSSRLCAEAFRHHHCQVGIFSVARQLYLLCHLSQGLWLSHCSQP